MTRRHIFIGECRSLTAIRKGWSWKDGRLAAKPLFEALEAMGIDPSAQEFCNLFTDPPPNHRGKFVPKINDGIVSGLHVLKTGNPPAVLVALGQRVSRALSELEIDHVALVHPAARGKIRKRERYHAHVQAKLRPYAKVAKLTPIMQDAMLGLHRLGCVDWRVTHARTIQALKHRGFIENGVGGWRLSKLGKNIVNSWRIS